MDQTHNLRAPPDQLVKYLEADKGHEDLVLRCRAVLTRSSEGRHLLVCCAVEAFPAIGNRPDAMPSCHYPEATLFEDWLTPEECRNFVGEVQGGTAAFGEVQIENRDNPSWSVERVPMTNDYMTRAGYVANIRFEKSAISFSQSPLCVPGQPYYPNLVEAARHWLPFTTYQGEMDGRNLGIHFLLPEARAFFSEANVRDGLWDVHVQGAKVGRLKLLVTGAYWKHNVISHFEEEVIEGRVSLFLPVDADRLEYVLMDSHGSVYDFQWENRFGHSGLGRNRLDFADRDFSEQVRKSCLYGEGVQIEFKSFVDPAESIGTKTKKTKMREVVMTVVAFANTQGGRLYIGIDDECQIRGINEGLERSAKAPVTDVSVAQYRGALTSSIRNELDGDVPMTISDTVVDGMPIIIVDVGQSPTKPVTIKGDNILYVRAGASNRQLPPAQWASALGTTTSGSGPFTNPF